MTNQRSRKYLSANYSQVINGFLSPKQQKTTTTKKFFFKEFKEKIKSAISRKKVEIRRKKVERRKRNKQEKEEILLLSQVCKGSFCFFCLQKSVIGIYLLMRH